MAPRSRTCIAGLLLSAALPSFAQQPPNPAELIAAQRAALAPLAYMDGVWRGPATTVLANGKQLAIIQTERIGPLLDGSVKVIEGRGYDAAGKTVFNALGIVSFDLASKRYTLHSYAMGRSGDFAITPTATGYAWEIPAGPATIRYTVDIKDGIWHEIGERLTPDKPAARFFEMTLKRVGDTQWPAGGTIAPK
ncbi:MAG: hypothetical protein ABIO38_07345 [Luteimonas sp.]